MKRLHLLDYGRFFAAIFVILFHYTFNGIAGGKISSISHSENLVAITKYGYLGVELFFMISGYVIFYSAINRTASQFAASRAERLYPLFWFAVLFTAAFAFFWGGPKMSVSPAQVLANLTMVPSVLGFNHVDGVYWTLLYELKFYAFIFVLILLGLQRKLDRIFLVWPFIMVIALMVGIDNRFLLGGYYSFFAAGGILAIAKDNLSWKTGIPLLVTYILCVNFSATNIKEIGTNIREIEFSGVIISFIISLFFGFFFILNSKRGSLLQLPKSSLLGALTYPIYLVHAHFGYMFISRFATEQNKIFIYIATLAIVFTVAYLMHTIIEVKYRIKWKSFFQYSVGKPVDVLQQQISNLRVVIKSRRQVKRT
jgi:peptidoglycan/LPS O-acetylase OafA/YrhL